MISSIILAVSLAFADESKSDVELSDTVSGRRVQSIDLPTDKFSWFLRRYKTRKISQAYL